MTAPLRMFFSFVRTNEPPLPGFTCWNSTTENSPSGKLRVIPFFRSFVDTATIWWQPLFRTRVARRSSRSSHLWREGQDFTTGAGNQDGVLGACAAEPRDVHAGFDGNHLTRAKYILRPHSQGGRFMDVEAHPVPGTVHEQLGVPAGVDDFAARPVDLCGRNAVAHCGKSGVLSRENHRGHPRKFRREVARAAGTD